MNIIFKQNVSISDTYLDTLDLDANLSIEVIHNNYNNFIILEYL